MSFRERMKQGKLGGLPFFTESVSDEFGRENVIHQPYKEDVALFQDVGRYADVFQLNGYLVGPDYDLERDAFIRLIKDTPGPYVLEHPYYGTINVVNQGKFRFDQTYRRAGIVQFSVTLVEVGEPRIDTPKRASASDKVKTAYVQVQRQFSSKFRPPKGSLRARVALGLVSVANRISRVSNRIATAALTVDQVATGINQFRRQIANLLNTPSALAASIANLIATSYGLFSDFYETAQDPPGIVTRPLKSLSKTATLVADDMMQLDLSELWAQIPVGVPAPQILEQRAAMVELELLVKVTALQQCCLYLVDPDTVYKTATDAEVARDKIVAHLDTIFMTADLSYEAYNALSIARAAVYSHLTELAGTLPRAYTYYPPKSLPLAVVTYRLYGNLDLFDELIERNKIEDPSRVLGGVGLEVLSND